MRLKKKAVAGLIMAGFVTMTAQVLITRELLAAFAGSELNVAAILAGWLFWAGLGSRLEKPASRLTGSPQNLIAALFALYFLTAPASILISRFAPLRLLGLMTGETATPGQALLFCFLAVMPASLPAGLFLSGGVRLFGEEEPGRETSIVFTADSAGSFAAGAVFTFVLAGNVSHTVVITIICLLCLCGIMAVKPGRKRIFQLAAIIALFIIAFYMIRLSGTALVRGLYTKWKWPEASGSEVSGKFGELVLVRHREGAALYYNGVYLSSPGDKLPAEEAAGLPMLFQKRDARILLIGGGSAGPAKAALKFPGADVTTAEFDPEVIKMVTRMENEFPGRIVHEDGRRFLLKNKEKFDAIIVLSGEPANAGLNRYYTREFFTLARSRLNQNGVFSAGIGSGEEYLGRYKLGYNATAYKTMKEVFPALRVIPGEKMYLLGFNGTQKGDFESETAALANFNGNNPGLDHLTPGFLSYKLDRQRAAAVIEKMETFPADINSDLMPSLYFQHARYIGGETKWLPAELLSKAGTGSFGIVMAGCAAFLVLTLLRLKKNRGRPVVFAAGATGFQSLSLEFVLLLFYQAKSGYLYTAIGVLLGAYMAGTAAGAALAGKPFLLSTGKTKKLITLQAYELLFLAGTAAGIYVLDTFPAGEMFTTLYIFIAILLTGTLAGLKVPLTAAVLGRGKAAEAAARIFWADLTGACAGALLTGAVFVPLYGVYGALALAALPPVAALAALAQPERR